MEDFTGTAGPKVAISNEPLDLFSLFFTDAIIDLIVRETNRYAGQVLAAKGSSKQWKTTAEEVRAYFGFCILMGMCKLPELRDYWSTDPRLHYAPIADKISRDRFEDITRYLHFADNERLPARGNPNFHRLQKILPIISAMKKQFREVYYPHREVSVDEAMIKFKGRSTMKQYMPIKPIKRGFKVWVLADALNGYFWDINPYVGAIRGEPCKQLGSKVVTTLTSGLFGHYHHVYMDNFFSGISLYKTLLDNKTYACGTVQSNRKDFPTDILSGAKTMTRGQSSFRQSGDLSAMVWMDKKPVTLLSTLATPNEIVSVKRKKKDGSAVEVACPKAVKVYNEFMSGVDKGDQQRGYYKVRCKSRKNYKYIFYFIFDTCITNSYILSKYSPSSIIVSKDNLKHFRLQLANRLIGTYMSRKRAGRPRSISLQPPPTSVIRLDHHPSHGGKSRRCRYCITRRRPSIRHDTVWVCPACPGTPSLCLSGQGDCFKLWHPNL